MRQTFDFERFTPPVLSESILRRELERRAQRRRTVLLAVAGALIEVLLVLLGLLCWYAVPALALASISFAAVSMVGSGVIVIVYAQKGEVNYGTGCENGNI